MTQALVLPFPIRPKYLAQIVVPRDMTKQEADRLCAFVMSVAAPATEEPPGEPKAIDKAKPPLLTKTGD